MIERAADLWVCHGRGDVVAVTTAGLVDWRGACVMPRGCAAEARRRFPGIERVLGELIRRSGHHVHELGNRLVSFPVEASPYENPDLRLIDRSCRELVALAAARGWQRVVVPRPGCGSGGLDWDEVRPILARHFDNRFLVIRKE